MVFASASSSPRLAAARHVVLVLLVINLPRGAPFASSSVSRAGTAKTTTTNGHVAWVPRLGPQRHPRSRGLVQQQQQQQQQRNSRVLFPFPTAAASSSSTESDQTQEPTRFLKCATCSAVYPITEAELSPNGARVRCAVCGNTWFQTPAKLLSLYDTHELVPYPEDQKSKYADREANKELRAQRDAARDRRRHVSAEGATIFVANLPFEADEETLEQFFVDYVPGLTAAGVSVARDDDGRSKGFGFVSCATEADALKAIDALHGSELLGRDIVVRMGHKAGGGK